TIKTDIVVLSCQFNAVMVRSICLYDHFSIKLMPSCPAAHLRNELECFFRGTEIRKMKHRVCSQYADQGDVFKIEPFCNHLRPEQYIGFMVGEFLKQSFMRSFSPRRIHVHPNDASFRNELCQCFLHPLGACSAESAQFARAACALDRHRRCIRAMMAVQPIVALMVSQ